MQLRVAAWVAVPCSCSGWMCRGMWPMWTWAVIIYPQIKFPRVEKQIPHKILLSHLNPMYLNYTNSLSNRGPPGTDTRGPQNPGGFPQFQNGPPPPGGNPTFWSPLRGVNWPRGENHVLNCSPGGNWFPPPNSPQKN
eukprot:FR743616.1.p3 GENE.FR743616.1~~FR743616.1.p3  ORF type:complete len:137 (+),score=30.96 FR743616.1:557-967(+)